MESVINMVNEERVIYTVKYFVEKVENGKQLFNSFSTNRMSIAKQEAVKLYKNFTSLQNLKDNDESKKILTVLISREICKANGIFVAEKVLIFNPTSGKFDNYAKFKEKETFESIKAVNESNISDDSWLVGDLKPRKITGPRHG